MVRTTIDRNEEYQSVYGSLGPHTGPGPLTRHAAHLGEPPQGRGCPNWQIGADPAEPRSETGSGDFSRLLCQSRLGSGHVILSAPVDETGTGAGGILSVDSRVFVDPPLKPFLRRELSKSEPAISRDCFVKVGWGEVMSSCLHLLLRLGPERAESYQ